MMGWRPCNSEPSSHRSLSRSLCLLWCIWRRIRGTNLSCVLRASVSLTIGLPPPLALRHAELHVLVGIGREAAGGRATVQALELGRRHYSFIRVVLADLIDRALKPDPICLEARLYAVRRRIRAREFACRGYISDVMAFSNAPIPRHHQIDVRADDRTFDRAGDWPVVGNKGRFSCRLAVGPNF